MAIIQTIRDKGAAIVIGVIALSLIGFLLMDAKSGSSKLFGSNNSTVVGKVNGDAIELEEFNSKVKDMEAQYGGAGRSMTYNIRQNVWDNLVGERLLSSEFKKLGLTFTGKEMSTLMFSDDAPAQLKQAQWLQNDSTHQYDIEKAKQWWAEAKKSKNEEQINAINSQIIAPMQLNALYTKYSSLVSGSVYMPTWMANTEKEEETSFANISYVAIPYSDISDSSVTVTDQDIDSYVQKHKAKYKQEAGRMISYVTFSSSPSAQDTAKTKETLELLKPTFAADTNTKVFLAKNTSATPFADAYVPKAKLPAVVKDTLASLPNGSVFGPYLDGANYVVAKKVDTKTMPDSIKCRHILLGTSIPDSIAKKRIDSIAAAIKAGANFDSLEAKYSTDKAAHKDKGVMTFDINTIQTGLAKEFGKFLLNDKGETKQVVKTEFGEHYVEILDKKNPQPVYKVAYLAKEIVPSDSTINTAQAAAIKLIGSVKDEKELDKYVKENQLQKISSPSVTKENDYQIGSLQDARDIVKWAFTADEGEVTKESYLIGNSYVVAVVSKKVNEGVPDAKTIRPQVESLVRMQKKAEQIKAKLGNITTLEAAAAAFKKQVLIIPGNDSTLTFKASLINGIGNEPKVAGAVFNKEYQSKVSPAIAGNTGVFLVKVISVGQKPETDEAINKKLSSRLNQLRQTAMGQSYQSLRKQADVVDKRSRFF
jgi:peptidyl-prolyl cis-trans isomerase D